MSIIDIIHAHIAKRRTTQRAHMAEYRQRRAAALKHTRGQA